MRPPSSTARESSAAVAVGAFPPNSVHGQPAPPAVVNRQVYAVASELPATSVTPETDTTYVVPPGRAAVGVKVRVRPAFADDTVPATAAPPSVATVMDPVPAPSGSV